MNLAIDNYSDTVYIADSIDSYLGDNSMNIRIYDNNGKTADRYTAVFMDEPERQHNTYAALGMDDTPFHPQGIGMHVSAMPGRHLGKRINFDQLPKDCQSLIRQQYDNSTVLTGSL